MWHVVSQQQVMLWSQETCTKAKASLEWTNLFLSGLRPTMCPATGVNFILCLQRLTFKPGNLTYWGNLHLQLLMIDTHEVHFNILLKLGASK